MLPNIASSNASSSTLFSSCGPKCTLLYHNKLSDENVAGKTLIGHKPKSIYLSPAQSIVIKAPANLRI